MSEILLDKLAQESSLVDYEPLDEPVDESLDVDCLGTPNSTCRQ